MTPTGTTDPADAVVRSAAAQLYAGLPGEFIATRTALVASARAEGHKDAAKEIGALRRPSVAAWVLNQLAHHGDSALAELANVGARLRHATAALDARGIAGMRGERDAALAALVSAAASVAEDAGQRLTSAVEAEVRDTGIAALADEAAESVLRSGTLTRALSYSGFGEVDLSEATATTSTGVVLTSLPGGRAKAARSVRRSSAGDTMVEEAPDEDELDADASDEDESGEDESGEEDGAAALEEAAAAEEHERRVAQAERALESATREVGRHRAALEAARNRSDATRQRLQKLQDQVERARTEDELALEKLTDAAQAAKAADADVAAARAALAELTE